LYNHCIVYNIAVSSWGGEVERWFVRSCYSWTEVGILATLWVWHSGLRPCGMIV